MTVAIPAKVFRTAEGQAVSIPPDFELPEGEFIVRQDGQRLVIEPVEKPLKAASPANQALVDLLMSWEPIDERFGPVDDQPAMPKTLRELLESWEPISDRIGPIEDLPPEPVNL